MKNKELTREEKIKEMTDFIHLYENESDERINELYIEKQELLKKWETNGWIMVGEVESNVFLFGKYIEEEPYFLFTKTYIKNGICYYKYAFSKSFKDPEWEGWSFALTKRYSINTILTMFISHDIQFQGAGHLTLKANNLKIRLVGSNGWLTTNENYLNRKIELDDLEKKFRSDKKQLIKF